MVKKTCKETIVSHVGLVKLGIEKGEGKTNKREERVEL